MDYYQQSPIEHRQRIGLLLERLRKQRNRVDYEDAVARVDAWCKTSITEAKEVFDCLKKT